MEKLERFTTHSVPRKISSDGNESYSTLHGLLDSSPRGGSMTGIICATIGLLCEENEMKLDPGRPDDSKYTYRDNDIVISLAPSLFYTTSKLFPEKCDTKDIFSNFINKELIETGYQKIVSSTDKDLCELFLSVLDD